MFSRVSQAAPGESGGRAPAESTVLHNEDNLYNVMEHAPALTLLFVLRSCSSVSFYLKMKLKKKKRKKHERPNPIKEQGS